MIKYVAIIASLAVLPGCASTQKTAGMEPQYCYTNQEIEIENGQKVSSLTRIECTDDRTKQLFQAKSGIARDCQEFFYQMPLNGRIVERRAYACQKFSGTSEVFNPAVNR